MNEREIFIQALRIADVREQDEFLDQACGNDSSLRKQIADLLTAYSRAHSFLEVPIEGVATIDQPITERPGTQIGPYKLLQQLGEGGMGVVYMAEQKEPVKRRVALKIIKPGMDTRQVIARFGAERQALAMMDHPNIAKVLDAGQTDSGRPYFVMELVNGLPVTKYCDEQHLTPKERLELFVPICQAVQHAHQKGIIHRDLKPSNILVALYDGRAVPKIIDFGVAKATSQTLTEKTMFTQLGQVVGTLEYMSPEQAERNQLDIDTRSDIYSLGVVLYELLTGETPFDRERLRSAAFDEMLRIIREEEPSKPSTKVSSSQSLPSIAANRRIEPTKLGSMIRGELDWIVLKAMEKDRGRRYETASKFAEDVQHYLNDEAVEACPPSRAYKFRKFARRNKAKLLVSLMLAATMLVVTGSFGWVVRDRATRQAELVRERQEREAELGRAREERFARTRAQLEIILSDVDRLAQEQRWDESLDAAKRAEALTHGEVEAAVIEEVRVAVRELGFVERLAEIRFEAASWYEEDSLAWRDRGVVGIDYSAGIRSYRAAFRDFGVDVENLPVEESLTRLRRHTRIALPLALGLDQFVSYLSSPGADETTWRPLLDVAQGLDPNPVRGHLRATWKQDVTPELQSALQTLVDTTELQKHPAETASLLASTLGRAELPELQEQVLRQAQQTYPGDYWLNFRLGAKLLDQPPYTDSIRFSTAAMAIKPDAVGAVLNLGTALSRQEKLDDAIACYRKARDLNPKLSATHNNLGLALWKQGKVDEAIGCYRKAIELDPNDAYPHINLGAVLTNQDKLDEAIASYHRAIELDPTYAYAHTNLGNALRKQGKLDEAIACYNKAIEIDPEYKNTHNELGIALKEQGDLDEAIACYNKAIELDPNFVPSLTNLGIALKEQGNLEEAIAYFNKAIELEPTYANAHDGLGNARSKLGKLNEAITCYNKAIELEPNVAIFHSNLGVALKDQGKLNEAIACYHTAIKLEPTCISAHVNLGNARSKQGKQNEAIDSYDRALELDPKNATVHDNLGLALWRQGKLEEALASYRRAIELQPDFAMVHNHIGFCREAQGKPYDAIASYRRAIELDPQYAPAHYNLGRVFKNQGKLTEAIACYRQGVELNPDDVAGVTNLAWLLSTAADVNLRSAEEAVRYARRAVELTPKAAKFWNLLGVAMFRAGDCTSAVDAFERAKSLSDSSDGVHRMVWAMACWKSGKQQEAIDHFIQAEEWGFQHPYETEQYAFRDEVIDLFADAEPDGVTLTIETLNRRMTDQTVSLRRIRAGLYAAQGALDEATADYASLLDKLPHSRNWSSARIRICRELADCSEVFERLAASRPDDESLWIGRAEQRLLESQWAEALADYAHLDPASHNDNVLFEYAALLALQDDQAGYKQLCQTLLTEAKPESASAAYAKARACCISPKSGVEAAQLVGWAKQGSAESRSASRLHVLGLAHYRAGQLDEAIDVLNESNTRNWFSTAKAQNHLVLAMAHYAAGRQAEAQEWLRRAQRMIDDVRRMPDKRGLRLAPPDWIALAVLQREAKELIDGSGREEVAGTVTNE